MNRASYRLKDMVIVRILAEVTVLVILVSLPFAFTAIGKFALLPMGGKAILVILSVLSVMLLPWYGFITYLVRLDDNGLSTRCLFRRQFCTWGEIRGLTRRASWGWLRYVVELEKAELTFPVWLKSVDELVQIIRGQLPAKGGGAKSPYRTFRLDPAALIVRIAQTIGAAVFLAVMWFFAFAAVQKHPGNTGDAALLMGFCLAASAVLIWRAVVVAKMPKLMALTKDAVTINSLVGQKTMPWQDVSSLGQSFPLLPEGFILKTKSGRYLIDSAMEGIDELQGIIQEELSKGAGGHSKNAAETETESVTLGKKELRQNEGKAE